MKIFAPFIKWKSQREYDKLYRSSITSYNQWKDVQKKWKLDEIEHAYHYPAIIYGDYEIERKNLSRTYSIEPMFLPDFSPNRWDYEDYLGPAVYVREDLLNSTDMNTISRRNLIQNLIEQGERVCHIPQILAKIQMDRIYKKAESEELSGYINIGEWTEEDVVLRSASTIDCNQCFTISVIIPSKNNIEMLEKVVKSVVATSNKYEEIKYNLEFVIVDNGSDEDTKNAVTVLCDSVDEKEEKTVICSYLYKEMDFNFSVMCNIGATHATGEILLFLNDDIEAKEHGWLESMIHEVIKPYTGAVGCKLLYPDGDIIQHAGITNLPMGPVHKLQHLSDKKTYYDHRNRGVHNVSAVTGACLMIRKEVFFRMQGMKVELPVAFNDVELCYHLLAYGYYNVVCCDVSLIHHESVSRGQDNSLEKRNRLLRERGKLYEIYPNMQGNDSYYPYALNHLYLNTKIEPAYLDGKAYVQVIEEPIFTYASIAGDFEQKRAHVALNDCLHLEVEQLYEELEMEVHIVGYAFVVGSDNALFDRYLLLESSKGYYKIALEAQYRSDLEEQLKDQVNVALCQFHVKCYKDELEQGTFRVGMVTKQRTNSLMLIQWSNVLLEV